MSRKLYKILQKDKDLETAFLCFYKNPAAIDEENDLVYLIEKKVAPEINAKQLIKELVKMKLLSLTILEFELNKNIGALVMPEATPIGQPLYDNYYQNA